MAFAQGNLADAEDLFQQALLREPQDPQMIAGMVRTRLRLGKLDIAGTLVRTALQALPPSAPLQVALADVQLREGRPWLAQEALDRAAEIDPCFAQIWLLRSRVDRLDSLYATERADIARAYAINSEDAEIRRTWNQLVSSAKDIESTEEYLRTTKDLDPKLREVAEETVRTTLPLLSETTQTCKGLPDDSTATIALVPSLEDGKHIDGYQTKVSFGQTKVTLVLDTAASGLYISRALADANGLTYRAGDPTGTVRAETVQVGPLTFHDCMVGVSETPFPNKGSGFMGTDLFAQYLTILNFPEAKLLLRALPAVKGVLPGDRPASPELSGYSPVYHRLQYLLMPVTLNGKERRLFVLDSGIRLSAMTLPVAHLVSTTRHGFTSSLKTVSGGTIQTYNDNFDMEFAHQIIRGRSGILQFDPVAIEQTAGMQIGGLIGLDLLQGAVLSLDYRDGLVHVDLPAGGSTRPGGNSLLARGGDARAQGATTCTKALPHEVPRAATILASNTGMWDVHQLKMGEVISLKVERPWETEGCRLERSALLYGRVVGLEKGKGGDPAHLGVAFDRAECFGRGKQDLALRLVSVQAAPAAYNNIDSSMPTAVLSGGGRQIGNAVTSAQEADDLDHSPQLKLQSIKTGSVDGLPAVQLETAGPACSAVLTGTGGTLRLGEGTRWLLVSTGKS